MGSQARAGGGTDRLQPAALPGWISDTLCRLVTRGGFAVRQLYTDQDEVPFDATRPPIDPVHLPMHQSLRCGARTRSGKPCQSPAVRNRRRCGRRPCNRALDSHNPR
jgi:hypothetical protein